MIEANETSTSLMTGLMTGQVIENETKGSEFPKAKFGSPDRPLRIGDLEIPCYVLDNGTRVLHQRGMVKSLGMSMGSSNNKGGDRLFKFVSGKNLEPYVSDNLRQLTGGPIKFLTPRGQLAYGYEATVLADICEVVLSARADGRLQKQQEHIAIQCETLIRAFARVGIIALVDEVTQYQEVRQRNDLQQLLKAYITPELLPWTLRFPDEFYRQLFRLHGWHYEPKSVKRPRLVGKRTVELIYDRLPQGVLEELRLKNPIVRPGVRRYKHHQFLTDDIGNPHLEKQVAISTALMRAAPNWITFKRMFERACPSQKAQPALFDDAEIEDEFAADLPAENIVQKRKDK